MPMCKMTRGLLKKQPNKLTWKNVYVLRQEYNKFQRRWFPVLLYWNSDGVRSWIEGLFTEGNGFYHDEMKYDWYDRVTRPGTGKCDQEEVTAMVKHYLDSCNEPQYQVSKLGSYKPSNPNYNE